MAEPSPRPNSYRLSPVEISELELIAAGVGPGATVGEALAGIFAASAVRLGNHEPLLGHDLDGEAVHQARVATRRLRSDLRTFGRLLDEGWTDQLREELKWLAALLGEARDADVMMERMTESLNHVEGPATGRRAILQPLVRRRKEARERMLQGVAGRRHARLVRAVRDAGHEPAVVERPDDVAGEVLPAFAVRPWRKLQKAVAQLGENPADEDLHAVRIAAKRARYAAEAVEPVVGPDARRFAGAVSALQESLGEYHDSVVARQWLGELAATVTRGGAFYAGALMERERVRGEAALDQWESAWKAASRKKLHAWMPGV